MLYALIALIMSACAITNKQCDKYVSVVNITCVKKKCVLTYTDGSKFYLPEEYARLIRIGDKSCVN